MNQEKKEELISEQNILSDIASLFPKEIAKFIESHDPIITSYRRITYSKNDGVIQSVFFGPKSKLPNSLNQIFDQIYSKIPNLDGYPGMYNVREIEGGYEKCDSSLPEVTFNVPQMLTIKL